MKSTANRVLGNTFDDGNDSVSIQESDRNLLQGNTFTKARHSLLSVRCGNFNVIRGNRFYNADQKACEIYDCEGQQHTLQTRHHPVIFSMGIYLRTPRLPIATPVNGIQYGGQNSIVRGSVSYSDQGGA